MPYAFVQDVLASRQQYQQTVARLLEPVPVGLILHVAGPTAEGVRVIGVWESEQAWQRFRAERLAPGIAALGGPAHPESIFRDLHPEHMIPRRAVSDEMGGRETELCEPFLRMSGAMPPTDEGGRDASYS